MTMARENSKQELMLDMMKNLLLQDVKFDKAALCSKTKKHDGHFVRNCPNKMKKKKIKARKINKDYVLLAVNGNRLLSARKIK